MEIESVYWLLELFYSTGKCLPHCKVFSSYRGADKSLARPGREQATATEDFDFHVSYL